MRSKKFTAEIIRICQNAITGGSFRKVLADRAKCSLRTIDNWISSDRTIQMEQFFNLLEAADGTACFEVLWEHVPERVRDRFFEAEALRRAIAEKQRQREVEDREYQARLRQLNMDLSKK
ncbi:hypothetical protein [Bradyrhizobium sp. 174]|uniref:hypothetical protein n=1 Tax=Bradyrhizobium sp. 174 TaxID=2782645 RepID=UPI001FFB4DE8|nr:hypothetical protein [Bradyrhizobium sp. 174]MCK1577855.1 hypothetical protein [Bradyrhizobium sp. 174]